MCVSRSLLCQAANFLHAPRTRVVCKLDVKRFYSDKLSNVPFSHLPVYVWLRLFRTTTSEFLGFPDQAT